MKRGMMFKLNFLRPQNPKEGNGIGGLIDEDEK